MVNQFSKTHYLRSPSDIYRQSLARVREETILHHLPEDLQDIALHLVHSCGMPDIVPDLAWSPNVTSIVCTALQDGVSILTDVEMVAHGISYRFSRDKNPVLCTINDPLVIPLANQLRTTRSAAAVTLWHDYLEKSVVVIGNAPTALFHLLELIASGWPRPAAILAFPVGFIGAAASKETLITYWTNTIPYLTLRGRRGGSALAVAAINALLQQASKAAEKGN